jgi:hypothetical protein
MMERGPHSQGKHKRVKTFETVKREKNIQNEQTHFQKVELKIYK